MSSLQRALDGLDAVGDLGDDLEVGRRVEHHAQPAPHDVVVVGEQDPGLQRRAHAAGPTRHDEPHLGPALRGCATEQRPPTSSARSCMPPSPLRAAACLAVDAAAVVADPQRDRRPPSPRGRASRCARRRGGPRWSGSPGRSGRSRGPARARARGVGVEPRPHARAAAVRRLRGERDQRAAQPELVERLRPQAARDLAHVLHAGAGRLLQLLDRAAGARPAPRAGAPSSCSTTPVSVWPISSCSSRASRPRSSSCAASARRPLSGARPRAGRASR